MGKIQKVRFSNAEFFKSSLSHRGRKVCVEVAIRPGIIGVRDSKNPKKGTLQFTRAEWKAFIGGVKKGEFDI